MVYVPPPDPQCSPVPLGIQPPSSLNNARANISNFAAPFNALGLSPTRTPQVPFPTPTPFARSGNNAWGNNPPLPQVTKTATQTLTAATPINPVDFPASILPRGDIDTGKALPSNVFGPYPQTLFLGCSVANFNVSLGWGNQPSQLSVTLVEDPSPHYTMTYDGGRYRNVAMGLQGSINHYYRQLKPIRDTRNNVIEDAQAYKTRIQSFLDTNGNVIVPGKLFYHYNTELGKIEQKYWLGPDPGFIAAKNRFRRNGIRKTGTDPITGLRNVELGEPTDIIGCPVFFQLDDFVFCGIVKSWRSVNSGTGGRSYQVDIEGPNEIINQAQLILSTYSGGVFVKSTDFPPEEIGGDPTSPPPRLPYISGPSNDLWVENVVLAEAFKGNVSQDGNIPNIINIYGFLEGMSPGGFGGANINDEGIKTNSVIYCLNYLLGIPRSETTTYPGQTVKNIFNPFGALVGRTPMSGTPKEPPSSDNNSGQGQDENEENGSDQQNTTDPPMAIYHPLGASVPKAKNSLHPIQNAISPITLSFPLSRLRERSAGNYSTSGTTSGFLEIGDDGTQYRNTRPIGADEGGEEYNIFDFGLIPPDDATETCLPSNNLVLNQQWKQLYYLDLGELPVVPMQMRTDCSQTIMDLNSFITEVCDKSGVDFFYELLYLKIYANKPPYKIIKLRTVSRKVQPSDRKISDYITSLREANVAVSSVSLGKEYNSSAKPRTMIIGAKQQRLFQTKNYGLAYKVSNYIYNPVHKRLITYYQQGGPRINNPHGPFRNYYRLPNPASTRDSPALNRKTKISRPNERPVRNYYLQEPSWNNVLGDNDIFPARGNYMPSDMNIPTQPTNTETVWNKTTEYHITFSDNTLAKLGRVLFDWSIDTFVSTTRAGGITRSLHEVSPFWVSSFIGNSVFGSSNDSYIEVNSETTALRNFAKAIAEIGFNTWNMNNLSHYLNNRLKYLIDKDNAWQRDDSLTRFLPMMYNSICPYFGDVDFIDKSQRNYAFVDKTRKPRAVWFDTWLNGMVVEFNVAELPVTRLELQGIFNGGTFIVHETELRAALLGYDNWIAYLSMRIHDPHIKQMVKNAVCGNRNIPPVERRQQATRRNEPPAPSAVNNNSVSNSMGQGGNKPQQKDTKSDDKVTSDNEWDACAIFCALFKIETSLNQKTKSANAGAGTPKNRHSGLQSALQDDLVTLHSFFKRVADEYYGKQFMVRIPSILSYRDRDIMINMDPRPTPTPAPNSANTSPPTNASYVNVGSADNPRYLTEGTGKIYSNYNISPDGAWEEYGNSIDDCLMVGGYAASIFTDDNGRIKPILAYPADDKFDYEAFWCCEWVKDNVCKLINGPNIFYYYDILKRSNALSNATRYTDFNPPNDPNGGNGCQ
jgi:hypothetical protein